MSTTSPNVRSAMLRLTPGSRSLRYVTAAANVRNVASIINTVRRFHDIPLKLRVQVDDGVVVVRCEKEGE